MRRSVALVALAPRLRSTAKAEQPAWTAAELQQFLLPPPDTGTPSILVAAFTGVRRSELLGLRWDDFEEHAATLSINRGLVAVDYALRETRGKTANARRRIDLDATTGAVLVAWRTWQTAEQHAAGIESRGWIFTDTNGERSILTRSRRASSASPGAPGLCEDVQFAAFAQ